MLFPQGNLKIVGLGNNIRSLMTASSSRPCCLSLSLMSASSRIGRNQAWSGCRYDRGELTIFYAIFYAKKINGGKINLKEEREKRVNLAKSLLFVRKIVKMFPSLSLSLALSLFVSVSVSLGLFLSLCLYVYLSFSLSLFIFFSLSLSIYIFNSSLSSSGSEEFQVKIPYFIMR